MKKEHATAATSSTVDTTGQDARKAHLESVSRNSKRMRPGVVETTSSGQRVIHPAANPQQVNPIHDDEHEAAAVNAAKVLTDKKSTVAEKNEAVAASNEAEGAPSALAQKMHDLAVKEDEKHNKRVREQEKTRKDRASKAKQKNS